MARFFLIADDFTGAIDSSAVFAGYDVTVRVVIADQLKEEDFQADILAVDSETRHLPMEQAYQIVWNLVKRAKLHHVPVIYKKTDSVLRGNVGAELSAALDATGGSRLHFIPAFPQIGRTTIDGIQYVEGVPVAESVFGRDPFEPVRVSDIAEILYEQIPRTELNVSVIPRGGQAPPDARGILVYDANQETELYKIGRDLSARNELNLLAGCAGMASIMPFLMRLTHRQVRCSAHQKILFVCGSINPISIDQCSFAQLNGAVRFHLPPEAKTDQDWISSPAAGQLAEQLARACRDHEITILDTGRQNAGGAAGPFSDLDPDPARSRVRIMDAMGCLMQRLLEFQPECTLMITGGDTLFGIMRRLNVSAFSPLEELAPGIILSAFIYKGYRWYMISKSGGMGDLEVLCNVNKALSDGRSEPNEQQTDYRNHHGRPVRERA